MLDYGEYPWFEAGVQKRGGKFQRHKWIRKSEESELSKIKDADVYGTVWQYKEKHNTKPNISPHVGPFVADYDHPSNLTKAKEDCVRFGKYFNVFYGIPMGCIRYYFTGAKGFRPIIPSECFLSEYIPNPEVVYKKLAGYIKVHTSSMDLSIYDHARLIREPNTINLKSGLYQIPLSYDELTHLSVDEIKRLAEEPRQVEFDVPVFNPRLNAVMHELANTKPDSRVIYKSTRNSDRKVTLDTLPRKFQYLLHMHEPGDRNPSMCVLVGLFETCGLSYDEARHELLEFNRRYCNPQKTEDEALVPLEYYYKKVKR